MNDQSSSETNANPTPEASSYEPRYGFLQLCADRRFHRALQDRFQIDAQKRFREPIEWSPERYWIHADAGGTPRMESLTIAPNYCYHDKGVRLMAWCAHGAECGGFPKGTTDEEIRTALITAVRTQAARYPLATHFIYFATIKKGAIKVERIKWPI